MDDNASIKPWFKRKIFGWGWYPSSPKGWVTTIVFIAIIILASNIFDRSFAFWLTVVVATIFFILIAKKKGEKSKWSWGYKDRRKDPDDPEEKYKKYY